MCMGRVELYKICLPRVFEVAIIEVAVALSCKGNHSDEKTGGLKVSTVPAMPLKSIDTTLMALYASWPTHDGGMHRMPLFKTRARIAIRVG